jgi:CRISPR/Cas system endoribonuclease Cas6 (RAMP superfamily)
VRVQPRTFAVAHRRALRGTRLDGTRISWRLDRAAKVQLRFERRRGRHWVKVGTITRSARAGAGVVRFTGRFGRKLLAPRRYRVVVSASAGGQRTPAKRVGFRVVKG